MKVSVIIRNRNEENHIGFAIQSCLDFFDKPEIIVVDDNSMDDSIRVVNLFKDRTKIKIVSIKNYTPGKSINLGVKYVTNPYTLILSAHSQITSVDKKQLLKDLSNNLAVFGNQTPIYKGRKISKRYVWSHFTTKREKNLFSSIENRPFLHNAFCYYNTEYLLKYPMPEQYSSKEDRYWAANILDEGFSYIYDGISQTCNHFYTSNGATWKGIG